MTSSLQESHNLWKSLTVPIFYIGLELGFPMGRDSATFRDKGTTGQAQNLTKGQDGSACQNLGRAAGRDSARI